MKEVLFFHPQNDFSGSTRVLANVIETEYSGRNISVITFNKTKGFLSIIQNVNIIPVKELRFKNKRIPLFTSIAWRLYAFWLSLKYGRKYDTFYINTILPYYAAIAGRLLHKNIIYHIHEKFVIKSSGIKFAEYILKNAKAKHIFVSEYVKKQYKLTGENIVKYNKLSPSFMKEVKYNPIEQRSRKNIIMMASLLKAKGLFTFVEVARMMPEYSFVLVISSNKKNIDDFFHCDIPANLHLYPVQQNIHPFLHSSDLILNLSIPSEWIETFGMTILEAMAYGIPAIVPNVGGPTEIVEDGYNGYCIDVTNTSLVSDTIKKVLEKEDEYTRLSNNALIRLKHFI